MVNNHIYHRGRRLSSSVFLVFFLFVIVGICIINIKSEYDGFQQLSRGYITDNAFFFEIHDPSRIEYRTGGVRYNEETGDLEIFGNAICEIESDGTIFVDNTPTSAEDPEYVFENRLISGNLTQIETFLSSGGDNYLSAVHRGEMRGIFYKGDIVKPPMISGRFFYEEECLSRARYAIIGSDYLVLEYKIDNDYYIDYEGVQYKVIGILGINCPSALDHIILVNLGSMTPEQQSNGRYYIDGKEDLENVLNNLNETCLSMFGQNLDLLDKPLIQETIYVKSNPIDKTLLIVLGALLIAFFSTIIIQKISDCNAINAELRTRSFIKSLMTASLKDLLCSLEGILCGVLTILFCLPLHVFVIPTEKIISNIVVVILGGILLIAVYSIAIIVKLNQIRH